MKKLNLFLFIILIESLILFTNILFSQVTDVDGNIYKTVKIGEQEWMAENLNVSHYRNGEQISEIKNDKAWYKLSKGAWCYYDNNDEYAITFGKLYNWYAVDDPRGLAPEGWHIPSDLEWKQLINYLGGNSTAGNKMKSTSYWIYDGNGTNISGFNAVPSGIRYDYERFGIFGSYCCYWSSTEIDTYSVWTQTLGFNYEDIMRFSGSKADGCSVRCIKD